MSLVGLTEGELLLWMLDLSAYLMKWTDRANGPHGEDDRESENRPFTWNSQFFYFLGFLAVAIPHDELVANFLEPITSFKDEAFHDAMSSFLGGFDAAMRATETKKPENPVAVRELLAARIKESRNYRRLGREKSFTSESHAGDALNAIFYHPPRFANFNRPNIPNGWSGLREVVPILTALVVGAPPSGYMASLFLNLVETFHDATFLPFVVQANDSMVLCLWGRQQLLVREGHGRSSLGLVATNRVGGPRCAFRRARRGRRPDEMPRHNGAFGRSPGSGN
jgi:hypothetical protein